MIDGVIMRAFYTLIILMYTAACHWTQRHAVVVVDSFVWHLDLYCVPALPILITGGVCYCSIPVGVNSHSTYKP